MPEIPWNTLKYLKLVLQFFICWIVPYRWHSKQKDQFYRVYLARIFYYRFVSLKKISQVSSLLEMGWFCKHHDGNECGTFWQVFRFFEYRDLLHTDNVDRPLQFCNKTFIELRYCAITHVIASYLIFVALSCKFLNMENVLLQTLVFCDATPVIFGTLASLPNPLIASCSSRQNSPFFFCDFYPGSRHCLVLFGAKCSCSLWYF